MRGKKSSKGSVLAKLNLLLFHPTQFFESVKEEKDEWISIKWAFGSFFVFGLLSAISAWLFQGWYSNNFANWDYAKYFSPQSNVDSVLLVGLFLVIQIVLLPVFHWLVGKLGGKPHRYQTTKSIMYAVVPSFLGAWIPIIGILSMFWGIYTEYAGMKVLQKLDWKKYILFFIVSLLLWVAFLVILTIILIILVAIVVLLFGGIFNR